MSSPHPASPQARAELVLGVLGGSGLYQIDGLVDPERVELRTPFGRPSAPYTRGFLPRPHAAPLRCVFLARHGEGHRISPSEIDYRANIHGLKQLGVTHLLSIGAVGSLSEEIEPGHLVVPDQFIDRTKARESSFFGGGCVAHVPFGEPTDAGLRALLLAALRAQPGLAGKVHDGGTCVVMEGPAFSTRAESELYRSFGAKVIGMTALPEAKLAREAEMAYALLALSTDYDCWRIGEEHVSVDTVMKIMAQNGAVARNTVLELGARLPARCADLPWPRALEYAIVTPREHIDEEARARLDLIVGHYL